MRRKLASAANELAFPRSYKVCPRALMYKLLERAVVQLTLSEERERLSVV